VLPDDYEAKSNNNVIASLAIMSSIAVFVIIIAVYITNKNQVELNTAKFTVEHNLARHAQDSPQLSDSHLSEGNTLNLEHADTHQDSPPVILNNEETDAKNNREII
jgi:preprotein translocase subunit Sec63